MIYRLIAPKWLNKPTLEGEFTDVDITKFNSQGYNIYYLPNYPSSYQRGTPIDGSIIDVFEYCFVDCDLKDKQYSSKTEFLEVLAEGIPTTRVIDSGNGIHAYWKVSNLDPISYLRFQRRLMRVYHTDEAVGQLFQLMRKPNTINNKLKDSPVPCVLLAQSTIEYTAEEFDRLLPPITAEDEEYCQNHYKRTYGLAQEIDIDDTLPTKFGSLLDSSKEAKSIWQGNVDDRSKGDFRLGHIMLAHGFTKEEALSVLINSPKAMERAPIHRKNYAINIVDKIYTFEKSKDSTTFSHTVRSILERGEETIKGTRFSCNRLIDDTVHGFRLGQVLGIIGGSGVGKTTLTLNTFLWFAEHNPDYNHFFFSLEQPVGEIASRIKTICQGNDMLFDKIHIVSNYGEDGTFKHYSMEVIEELLLDFEKGTGKKVGAVVIDHIGVLAKSDKNGENEGLIGICRKMKAAAVKVNMMLIMLSQAPREKAGIGDLELNKDAAYGTVFFESFLDYCLCLWQPLKRAYSQGAPTVMAFKFAKIRHKKQGQDNIQEDVCYQLYFDPKTELLRALTQDEETSAKFYLAVATNLRKLDRKTELIPYQSRRVEELDATETDSNRQS